MEDLPELLHIPTDIGKYRSDRHGILQRYKPVALSLDDLPPELSDLNCQNTRFVPPVIYFGFEVPNSQYFDPIFEHFEAIRTEIAFGLDGKAVKIIVLDSNEKRMEPEPQEAVKEVEKILGHPPKLYISFSHSSWRLRQHYHYAGDNAAASSIDFNADGSFQMIECPVSAIFHPSSASALTAL